MTNFEVVTTLERPNWGRISWLFFVVFCSAATIYAYCIGTIGMACAFDGTDVYGQPLGLRFQVFMGAIGGFGYAFTVLLADMVCVIARDSTWSSGS